MHFITPHFGQNHSNMGIQRFISSIFSARFGPFYRHFRKKRIVMFHAGRSGSSVLGLMLGAHPHIMWAGEILKDRKVAQYKEQNANFDYREVIRSDEARTMRKCYGFEIMYMHMRKLGISKEQFLTAILDLGYTHFIVLSRKNVLRKVTSMMVAQTTGRYHLGMSKSTQLVQVMLDTHELIKKFDQYGTDIAEMQQLLENRKCLSLTYEDDVEQDPSIAYSKICRFLQIPLYPVAPKLQRINPYPLEHMIINFDEVATTLQGTKYEWMLER